MTNKPDVPSQDQRQEPLETRYFVLGILLLVSAIAFAAWGFYEDCLSVSRQNILRWALPLASGFSAWSFSGAIHAKVANGLIVAATGGFAVYLITVYTLIPTQDSSCQPQNACVNEINDLRYLGKALYAYDKNPNLAELHKVDREALGSARSISRVLRSPSGLSAQETISCRGFAGFGYMISAMALLMLSDYKLEAADQARVEKRINEALSNLRAGLANYRSVDGTNSAEMDSDEVIEAQHWLDSQHQHPVDAWLAYNIGTSLATLAVSQSDPETRAQHAEAAFGAFGNVESSYLHSIPFRSTLVQNELCELNPDKDKGDLCRSRRG